MNIVYSPTLPAELRPTVEPLLEAHRAIVPDWCHRLTVYFDEGGNNGEYSASMGSDFEYRKAALRIYAGFLTDTQEMRERDIVHELFHLVTAPADDYAWRELKRALEAVDCGKLLVEAVRAAYKAQVEGVVQDLTNLYLAGRLNY